MKQPKGLGRGLDAIFGTDAVDAKLKPMSQMSEIDITEIIPNPTQPRTQFDEEALDELADSIRQLGVIQPITVKKSGDGKYIIISGERRWRAAQRADLTSLPAYIREVDDENLHAMALVENIQRQDLNAIEIALGMQRLIDECNLTQDALSEKVGKKRSTISNYMRLLKLPDEVQLALKEGLISMGHAKAIAGAPDGTQVRVLKRIIKKGLSVRQAEELVRSLTEQPAAAAQNVEDEEYPESYSRLVEQLEKFFSQDISIKRSKNGGGRIVIGFGDDKDIEQFIEQAHRYGDAKLMLCSSGNLSWRIGEEALISGTGSWVPTLGKEKVSICHIANGTPTNGVKPSMESTFHLGILRERPDVNVVLHFQSEYATAVSCMKNKPTNFNVTAEIPCHVGSEIPVIPYYRPGSPELAKAVVEAMLKHNSVLLTNHGQVVCGKDFDQVYERATFFEMACRIIVQSGGDYSVLTPAEIEDLEIYVLGKKTN